MKPETEQQVRAIIRDELQELLSRDRYIFHKTVQVLDGRHFQFGVSNGTKIGTASTQLIGFYGATPVDRPATVSDPSGGVTVDTEARNAIGAVIDRLQELGLIST